MSTFHIGNVSGQGNVFGDHNHVANGLSAVADLECTLWEHRGQLRDPRATDEAVQSLRTELRQPRPRRERVLELLSVISASAGGVAAIGAAVDAVRAAFQ